MKVSSFSRKSASNFIVQVKQHSSPSFFTDTNEDLFSIIRLEYILASKKETKILADAIVAESIGRVQIDSLCSHLSAFLSKWIWAPANDYDE